jgi:hypothetical protein
MSARKRSLANIQPPPNLAKSGNTLAMDRGRDAVRHAGGCDRDWELGLTPASAAKLGLDLTRAEQIAEDRLRSVEGAAARAEARINGET